MTKFFGTPFAQAGNKTVVPDALQPDGSVSYTEGWGSDYELDNAEPDYKPIGREQTNQMFFDITEALGLVQREGILFWDATFAYSQHARVVGSDGQVYKAVIANTGNDPTADLGTNWVLDSQVVLASQAEAEAGINNTNVMTPLRTKQAIDALAGFVKLKSSRTTTGTWTITGLVVGRPLCIAISDTSDDGVLYKIVSGTDDAITSASRYHGMASRANFTNNTPSSFVVIPTATTVEITIQSLQSGATMRAYQ